MSAMVMYWSRFSALMTSSGFCSLSLSGRSRISMYSLRFAGPRCCSFCWARAGAISRTAMKKMRENFDRRSMFLVPIIGGVAWDTCREHDGQRRLVGLVRRSVVGFSWNEEHLVAVPQADDHAVV